MKPREAQGQEKNREGDGQPSDDKAKKGRELKKGEKIDVGKTRRRKEIQEERQIEKVRKESKKRRYFITFSLVSSSLDHT